MQTGTRTLITIVVALTSLGTVSERVREFADFAPELSIVPPDVPAKRQGYSGILERWWRYRRGPRPR